MPDIVFECPECGKQVVYEARFVGRTVACPKCMKSIVIPEPVAPEPPNPWKQFGIWLARSIALFLLVTWPLTLFLGSRSVRPDGERVMQNLGKEYRTRELHVRAPLPFILSYRVRASGTIEGMPSKYTRKEYYVWCFKYKRQLDSRSVPGFLNWVWLR